jgi:gliding motility-associated lipoprotein GldD
MAKFPLYFSRFSFKSNSYFCAMFKKLIFTFLGFFLLSCAEDPLPKPSGELRLEYPIAKYEKFVSPCNFGFEYSTFAKVKEAKNPCWYYIEYPKMKAKVFLTYFPIKNDFKEHVRESEKMVYEHTIKASSIDTKSFSYPDRKVFGNFYELKGPSASNLQFFVTDSTRYYVTANLYFNSRPKPDSLAPAIEYIKNDMLHLIETFEWK